MNGWVWLGITVLLLITHGAVALWVLVRLARHKDWVFYERYYKPLMDRDTRVLREMTALVKAEDPTQHNVRLLYENRRLKRKAIRLAQRYGALNVVSKREALRLKSRSSLSHMAELIATFMLDRNRD